jgi:carbon-monoxide dehydrogenase medium subunit
MLLPRFKFHEPTQIGEACRLLRRHKDNAHFVAGGTDLLVNMKKGVVSPGHVVSLSRIEELKTIKWTDDHLIIGGCREVAGLCESESIRDTFGALASAAGSLGSPLVRNLATIGGNLVSARPAADLPPPLMVYNAKILLRSLNGKRTVNVEDFFAGPGMTIKEPDEILVAVSMDRPASNSGAGFCKLGVRKSLEVSLVNAAAAISLCDSGSGIKTARIALGGVAPTPIRCFYAEKSLCGNKPSAESFAIAGSAAARECSPIDDFRGKAEYKRDMAAVLTKRALTEAAAAAMGQT